MAKIEIAGVPPEHLASLLAIGVFHQVTVNWNQEKFVPSDEQLIQIEERWNLYKEQHPRAFSGPISRVMSYGIFGGGLELSMQPATFKEFVSLQTNDDASKWGVENLANPLSVSMAVHTSDGKWLLTKKMRGDRIGSLDAVGGYLNPEKDENDPINTARREYAEETGSGEDSIRVMILLALQYEFKNLCHPVLSVLVESSLTSQEILELAPKNADGEVELLVVEDPVQKMMELEQQGTEVEPDGQLTFALAMAYLADPTTFENSMMVTQLSELEVN